MTINIAELRESIAAFGSQAINEDDLNELLTRLESEEEANREWDKKMYWVQEEVQKGDLPLNYLGWHRADIDYCALTKMSQYKPASSGQPTSN